MVDLKRMPLFLFSCLCFALVLISCKSQEKADVKGIGQEEKKLPDSLFAAIERSPCFGRCPTYVISVYSSGYVVYEGKQWVDNIGFFYTFITLKKLAEIAKMAENIDFAGLKDAYHDPNIMDAPSTWTSFRVNGKIKRIDNTFGAAPQGLVDFEKYLDESFKETKWIKIKENIK